MVRKNHQALVQSRLVGKRCWYVGSGGSVSPSINLALGGRILRSRRLKNSAHPMEYREAEGEIGLLVWCTWRLRSGSEVVATSDQEDDEASVGLESLLGRICEHISFKEGTSDLVLEFDQAVTLDVFCDHAGKTASIDTNWEISAPDLSMFAGLGGRVEWEEAETRLALTDEVTPSRRLS